MLKENNSLTGGIFPHFNAYLTKLCQPLFLWKGILFHLFSNKIAAHSLVGRGNNQKNLKKKPKPKPPKTLKKNTPLKSNQSFIFVWKKGSKGELKKFGDKLECDQFVTNSMKQDKILTSNGSFNLSVFEGGLKGCATEPWAMWGY